MAAHGGAGSVEVPGWNPRDFRAANKRASDGSGVPCVTALAALPATPAPPLSTHASGLGGSSTADTAAGNAGERLMPAAQCASGGLQQLPKELAAPLGGAAGESARAVAELQQQQRSASPGSSKGEPSPATASPASGAAAAARTLTAPGIQHRSPGQPLAAAAGSVSSSRSMQQLLELEQWAESAGKATSNQQPASAGPGVRTAPPSPCSRGLGPPMQPLSPMQRVWLPMQPPLATAAPAPSAATLSSAGAGTGAGSGCGGTGAGAGTGRDIGAGTGAASTGKCSAGAGTGNTGSTGAGAASTGEGTVTATATGTGADGHAGAGADADAGTGAGTGAAAAPPGPATARADKPVAPAAPAAPAPAASQHAAPPSPVPPCRDRGGMCLLPPARSPPRKTLVLDLDHTLILCTSMDAEAHGKPDFIYTDVLGCKAKVWKRPHLMEFLQTVSKHFEVVLFTAASQRHADAVMSVLDPFKLLVEHRLYGHHTVQSPQWAWAKDLSRLGRNLSHTVIVDDCERAVTYQRRNWISIQPYHKPRACDTALLDILSFLMHKVLPCSDVRDAISGHLQCNTSAPPNSRVSWKVVAQSVDIQADLAVAGPTVGGGNGAGGSVGVSDTSASAGGGEATGSGADAGQAAGQEGGRAGGGRLQGGQEEGAKEEGGREEKQREGDDRGAISGGGVVVVANSDAAGAWGRGGTDLNTAHTSVKSDGLVAGAQGGSVGNEGAHELVCVGGDAGGTSAVESSAGGTNTGESSAGGISAGVSSAGGISAGREGGAQALGADVHSAHVQDPVQDAAAPVPSPGAAHQTVVVCSGRFRVELEVETEGEAAWGEGQGQGQGQGQGVGTGEASTGLASEATAAAAAGVESVGDGCGAAAKDTGAGGVTVTAAGLAPTVPAGLVQAAAAGLVRAAPAGLAQAVFAVPVQAREDVADDCDTPMPDREAASVAEGRCPCDELLPVAMESDSISDVEWADVEGGGGGGLTVAMDLSGSS